MRCCIAARRVWPCTACISRAAPSTYASAAIRRSSSPLTHAPSASGAWAITRAVTSCTSTPGACATGELAVRRHRLEPEQGFEAAVLAVDVVEEVHGPVLGGNRGPVENQHVHRLREFDLEGRVALHRRTDLFRRPVSRGSTHDRGGECHGVADADAAVTEGPARLGEQPLCRCRMQIHV